MQYTDSKGGLWHIRQNWHCLGPRWVYWHADYDGAPDSRDDRQGYADCAEDAKQQIEEIIE